MHEKNLYTIFNFPFNFKQQIMKIQKPVKHIQFKYLQYFNILACNNLEFLRKKNITNQKSPNLQMNFKTVHKYILSITNNNIISYSMGTAYFFMSNITKFIIIKFLTWSIFLLWTIFQKNNFHPIQLSQNHSENFNKTI